MESASKTFAIQRAEIDDAPAVTELVNAAFAPEITFREGPRTSLDKIQAYFEKGSFFVMKDGSHMAACVYIEERGEAGYIGMLSVVPPRQKQGLGRKLMDFAERELQRRGCRRAELAIVNVNDHLEKLYGHLGYRTVGTAPYPPEIATWVPVHFIRMEKELTDCEGATAGPPVQKPPE